MKPALLAEVTRGGWVESMHYGSVAVVNRHGQVLYQAGDPHFLTFTRSTLKPFQAMPFVAEQGLAQFRFGKQELALMCASHSGEPKHIQLVQAMLERIGCKEQDLQCGCHPPLYLNIQGSPHPEGDRYTQLHHNCSGKHAGFLAYCRQHGCSLQDYLDIRHPLQQKISACAGHLCGVPVADLKSGTDGCSAPNYAVRLSGLALAYARLAAQSEESEYGDAAKRIYDAMTSHPDLVSGTGRSDLAIMQAGQGDWVAKAGAEGVQAIGIRSAGLGIAIKMADGSARALSTVTIAVLQQLGLADSPERSPMAQWFKPQLHNYRGLPVGEIRSVFKLKRHER